MRKLSTKVLNAHPEIALILDEVKARKAALINAKIQKAASEEAFKSAKKALKRQVKTLSKARKKGKPTIDSVAEETLAEATSTQAATKKLRPASSKKSTAKKAS
jgi:hypothetical protein